MRQRRLSQTEERLEFALRAARLGSWDFDIVTGRFTSSGHSRACHMRLPLSAKLRLAEADAAVSPPRPVAAPARRRRGRAPR